MKVIRRSVFETNSSSTHNFTIDTYFDNNGSLPMRLPDNRNSNTVGEFDILRMPIVQDGIVYDEINKTRLLISLISEYLFYEHEEELRNKWQCMHGPNYKMTYKDWDAYYVFRDKQNELKGTKKYYLENKMWGYLNSVLKKERNFIIPIYQTVIYPPFVSGFVDMDLGCEGNGKYYRELGLSRNMSRADCIAVFRNFIFNDKIAVEQSTYHS